MASASATSTRALSMEFKALQKEPVEGFLVTIPDDSDFYTWQVAIFGPPDTPYAGGYFKVSSLSACVAHVNIHHGPGWFSEEYLTILSHENILCVPHFSYT